MELRQIPWNVKQRSHSEEYNGSHNWTKNVDFFVTVNIILFFSSLGLVTSDVCVGKCVGREKARRIKGNNNKEEIER